MIHTILKHVGAAVVAVAMAATVSPMLKAKQTIQEIFAREGIHFDFRMKPKAEIKAASQSVVAKVIVTEKP